MKESWPGKMQEKGGRKEGALQAWGRSNWAVLRECGRTAAREGSVTKG